MYNTKRALPLLPGLGPVGRGRLGHQQNIGDDVARPWNGAKTTRYRAACGLRQVEENRETLEVLPSTTLFRRPSPKEWSGIMELARIHNYIPSCLLVLVGAWKCVGFAWNAFGMVRVWAAALVAGGVAVGSVMVNDYFDYLSGVDNLNAPSKPLPSGTIRPDVALLITLGFYISVLVACCLMEPPLLRWIIAASATSTFVYTPLLKSLTLVKNFVVAYVIALSPITGAVASGMGMEGVKLLIPPSAFLFGCVIFREILMDIKDARGDQVARVYTLPVVCGKSCALGFALLSLSLGSLRGWFALKSASLLPHNLSIFLLLAVVSPLYWSTWTVWKSRFDVRVVDSVVNSAMLYIGLGFLTLVALT